MRRRRLFVAAVAALPVLTACRSGSEPPDVAPTPSAVAGPCGAAPGSRVPLPLPAGDAVSVAADVTSGRVVVLLSSQGRSVLALVGGRDCRDGGTVTLAGGEPRSVTVEPGGARAYVSHSTSSVSVVDLVARHVVRTYRTGNAPGPIAVSPARHTVAVLNTFDAPETATSTVTVVDTVDGRSRTITGLPAPGGIAIDETHNRLLVAVRGGLVVVDLLRPASRRTVKIGRQPTDVVIDASRGRVLVTDRDERALLVLHGDDLRELGRVTLPDVPDGLAVDAASGNAYVPLADLHQVTRVTLDTAGKPAVASPLSGIAGLPRQLAIDPILRQLYVLQESPPAVEAVTLASFG